MFRNCRGRGEDGCDVREREAKAAVGHTASGTDTSNLQVHVNSE